MVNGIEHVAVVSKNTAALKDWYMEMYGDETTTSDRKRASNRRWRWRIEEKIDKEIAFVTKK